MVKRSTFAGRLTVVLLALLYGLAAAGCSGLSGEPRVVTTLRPAAMPVPAVGAADPITQGAQIFAARCTSCHGLSGRGDGELVRAGQIAKVPDFTDPERQNTRTAEYYFEVITNGRLESLMPPWKDALSEDERWAVANYALSLAGGTQSGTQATPPPDGASTADAVSPTNVTPDATLTPEEIITGPVEGVIVNGTEGGTVPETLSVLLFAINPAGEEVFTGLTEATDGAFRFEDIPIKVNNAYFTSTVYNEVTFVGSLNLTEDVMPSEPMLTIPLTIYEITSDPTVIEIDLLLNQTAIRSAGLLDNLIVTSFHNSSDRVYREAEMLTDERYGSVGIRLPAGAEPIGVDTTRYFWDQNDLRVVDTLAVIPGTQHIMHVSYTLPLIERITYEYVVDYRVTNQPELMLRPGTFLVDSAQFQSQGVRQFTGGEFEDFLAQPLEAGATVKFDLMAIQSGTADVNASPNPPIYGIILILGGIVLMAGAAAIYLVQRRQDSAAQALVAQIAALDIEYQDGKIDEQVYQDMRERLKQKLAGILRQTPPQ